jgi:uncharacterized membrane protein
VDGTALTRRYIYVGYDEKLKVRYEVVLDFNDDQRTITMTTITNYQETGMYYFKIDFGGNIGTKYYLYYSTYDGCIQTIPAGATAATVEVFHQ